MARQRHKPAENVAKLQHVDGLRLQGRAFVVERVNGQGETDFAGRFMHVRGTIKAECQHRHTRPRRRSDIPPRSLQAGSGLTEVSAMPLSAAAKSLTQ